MAEDRVDYSPDTATQSEGDVPSTGIRAALEEEVLFGPRRI